MLQTHFIKSILIINKTEIINFEKKYGIDKNNIKTVKVKIQNGLHLWDSISLNMIERITVVKTFCLGRLSFVASFMCVKEEDIKEIEKMFYSFIWNGVIEKIKIKTLIMPYEKGGLNMISIRAKIENILFQQFKYFVQNRDRVFYQLSVFWLKFYMRSANLRNFNTIPMGKDRDRPEFYNEDYYKTISTYKYCIWRLRNIVRNQRAENIKVLFNYLFFKFLNK